MKLLTDLCKISSPSNHEETISDFICNYVTKLDPSIVIEEDTIKNLYITKGEAESYPTIVAHMDQVQDTTPTHVYQLGDFILGFNDTTKKSVGLGFDDKAGIYIALKMLEKYPAVKCAFFVGEEKGCIGSKACDMSFFDDSRFVLQCDRRGNSDVITSIYSTELCSKEFIEDIDAKTYGYAPEKGAMTDVYTLKTRGVNVSVINMSCGYYNPHTEYEVESITDLNKCMAFVDHIFNDCTKVYKHEKPVYKYPSYTEGYKGYYGGGYNGYGDYNDYDGYPYNPNKKSELPAKISQTVPSEDQPSTDKKK